MSNETGVGFNEFFVTFEKESYSSKLIFSVALLVVFVVGCVANIVICIVIYCSKTMRTATNYYLFDLAVSDLIVTFPILTMAYYNFYTNGNAMYYNTKIITCQLFICIQFILVALLFNHGILVMTALSIERYFAICHPFRLQRVPVWRRVIKIILVLWAIAIGETLPIFWTLEIIATKTDFKCIILTTFTAKIITVSFAVIAFLIPLSIMIFVYSMIAFRVKNHVKFNLNYSMMNKGIRNGKNVVKLIVALMLSFIVCWLPNFSMKILIHFHDMKTSANLEWFVTFHKIATFNSWLTTVINPLLFSLISVKFRRAVKMVWDKLIKKRVSEASISGERTREFLWKSSQDTR